MQNKTNFPCMSQLVSADQGFVQQAHLFADMSANFLPPLQSFELL